MSAPGAADLPLDVLALALAHCRARPRLWAASLVCKRWRAAALLSMTKVTLRGDAPQAALALFPRLADLRLEATPATALVLPAAITRLRVLPPEPLHRRGAAPPRIALAAPLRALTLSYCAANALLSPLMIASAASLTALDVGELDAPAALAALNAARLPALASLSVFLSNDATLAALAPFLAAHAAQLAALRLEGRHYGDDPRALTALAFPRLRTLALLRLEPPLSAADVAALLAQCPALAALRYVDYAAHVFAVPPALLARLARLDLTLDAVDTAARAAFLAPLAPRLRLRGPQALPDVLLPCAYHLPYALDDPAPWDRLAARDPRYARVRLLRLTVPAPNAAVRLHLPALRFVDISHAFELDEFERTVRVLLASQGGTLPKMHLLPPADFFKAANLRRALALLAEISAAGVSKVLMSGIQTPEFAQALDKERRTALPWLTVKRCWYKTR